MSEAVDFGVYVHIPFCRAKCRYCDFNSYAGREELIPVYLAALAGELVAAAPRAVGRRARTLYLGGGTPSLLAPASLAQLVERVRRLFALPAESEITLEANPGTVDEAYLRGARQAGINRLSLGVQGFDDRRLRFLGRIHSTSTAIAAYEAARRAGFANLSIDLIYCLPGETAAQVRSELAQAVTLVPEHLSLYGLSIEGETPLAADVASGLVTPTSADESAALHEVAAEVLEAAGYVQYEVSNWARRGPRGELVLCQHNLGYWRNEPYIGFGAGAHSYFGGRRYRNVADPAVYVDRVVAGGEAVADGEDVDPATSARDTLMLGLRLADGVSLPALAGRHGIDLAAVCGEELDVLASLGLLTWSAERVALTRRGRLVLDEILLRLLPKLEAG